MRFTLVYRGQLPSAQNKAANVQLRHSIREHFAAQIRDLMSVPPLDGAGFWDGSKNPDLRVEVGTAWFAPLVHSKLHGLAELDVLMLRPGPPGKLVHFGDIDNRLKTLLDCLRRPQQATELPAGLSIPADQAMPVLLDDDALVSRVNVDTDRLLGMPGNYPRASDVEVVIRVETRVTQQTYASMLLG